MTRAVAALLLNFSMASTAAGQEFPRFASAAETAGCRPLGMVTGSSSPLHGMLTTNPLFHGAGAELSLHRAREEARRQAAERGADTLVITRLDEGYFNATVYAAAFDCAPRLRSE